MSIATRSIRLQCFDCFSNVPFPTTFSASQLFWSWDWIGKWNLSPWTGQRWTKNQVATLGRLLGDCFRPRIFFLPSFGRRNCQSLTDSTFFFPSSISNAHKFRLLGNKYTVRMLKKDASIERRSTMAGQGTRFIWVKQASKQWRKEGRMEEGRWRVKRMDQIDGKQRKKITNYPSKVNTKLRLGQWKRIQQCKENLLYAGRRRKCNSFVPIHDNFAYSELVTQWSIITDWVENMVLLFIERLSEGIIPQGHH